MDKQPGAYEAGVSRIPAKPQYPVPVWSILVELQTEPAAGNCASQTEDQCLGANSKKDHCEQD